MKRILLTLLLLGAAARGASALVADKINFQGRLVDPATQEVLDGSVDITFRVCDSLASSCTGGAKLWEETQTVTVANGVFEAVLGGDVPISSAVFSGTEQYLEIQVETTVLSPRERIATKPAALRAAIAESVEPGSSDYIALGDTLQEGATFYVSSATVQTDFGANGDVTVAGALSAGGNLNSGGTLTAGSGATVLTSAAGLLDASMFDPAALIPNAAVDPSSTVKFSGSGLVPSAFLETSSITKRGSVFNAADRLALLDGSGKILNASFIGSSITKLGNAHNLADGPVKIRSDGFIENFLLDGTTVVKLGAGERVPDALIDGSSVTKQGNTFNVANRLVKMDQNRNAALPYGLNVSTGRFSVNLSVNASPVDEALHIQNGTIKVQDGQLLLNNSDIKITTTTGSRGVTYYDGSRQIRAPRWQFVDEQTGPDTITFSGLNGNVDETYLLVYQVFCDGTTEWGLRFNGDTGNNYEMVNANATGGDETYNGDDTGAVSLMQIPAQFAQAGGDAFAGQMKIFARTGIWRHAVDHHVRDDGDNSEFGIGAGWWRNTGANITDISIVGDFGAGSRFILYKRGK